jgi:signal transduction histidine kinase
MTRAIADFSCALCASATLLGSVYLIRARPRRGWFFPISLAWIVLTGWLVGVALAVRAPLSEIRMRLLLAALCVALGPWLVVALTVGSTSVRSTLVRWRWLLVGGIASTAVATGLMWWRGLDWVTGIGPLPTTVFAGPGLIALGAALVPTTAAAIVLIRRATHDVVTMPAVAVGTIGAIGSIMWVAVVGLWRGYVTTADLTATATLAGASALVWAGGILRQLPVARPVLPSRGAVYAAAAISIVLSYAVAARVVYVAFAPAAAALPEVLPAVLFVAAAGLVITLGSQRTRHRLKSAIGRYVFRSKHDYGAVWVTLTRLVTEARDRSDLVQRVAVFCRDLLCVDRVGVYLYDSAGTVRAAAFAAPAKHGVQPLHLSDGSAAAGANGTAVESTAAGPGGAPPVPADLFCPMRVNGHLLGFIAIGSGMQTLQLDDEDRQVMDYITAQVASALELYRLGEEIGDAREVGSFHRLSAFIIHDLKNAVAQQSFVLENAQKYSGDPAFVTDALAAFSDSTSRMRSLMARLRAGEPSTGAPDSACDVLELLRELTALSRLPEQCRVRVTVPANVTSCQVRVERSALTQVLTNVLLNAVESLPADHGEVEARVSGTDGEWCVEVRDNGCGIPESYMRDHLFRPFRSTKDAGLGIGLYQCKVLVEAAGGRIHITSLPNSGTTVRLMLPAARSGLASAAAVRRSAEHGQADGTHR